PDKAACRDRLRLCQERGRRRVPGNLLGVPKVMEIVALAPADGDDHREGLASSTRTADSLLVVETLRRHVCLENGLERANIYTDLHRRSHRQEVDDLSLSQRWACIPAVNVA